MSSVEPKGYQGWKNYETWAVHLWISNDQGTHFMYDEQAAEQYREAVRHDKTSGREEWTEQAASVLAGQMEEDIANEEACPVLSASTVYTDLLRSALDEVDWAEIAVAYVENIDRDEIEAEERHGEPNAE